MCVCHVLHINQVSDRTLDLRLKFETLISALGRRTRKALETAGVNSGGSLVLLQRVARTPLTDDIFRTRMNASALSHLLPRKTKKRFLTISICVCL